MFSCRVKTQNRACPQAHIRPLSERRPWQWRWPFWVACHAWEEPLATQEVATRTATKLGLRRWPGQPPYQSGGGCHGSHTALSGGSGQGGHIACSGGGGQGGHLAWSGGSLAASAINGLAACAVAMMATHWLTGPVPGARTDECLHCGVPPLMSASTVG